MSERDERQALAREQIVGDLRAVLSAAAGRRFVAWLIHEVVAIHREGLSPTDRQDAFRQGQRDVGLFLYRQAEEHAPEAFDEMEREYRAAKREARALRAAAGGADDE